MAKNITIDTTFLNDSNFSMIQLHSTKCNSIQYAYVQDNILPNEIEYSIDWWENQHTKSPYWLYKWETESIYSNELSWIINVNNLFSPKVKEILCKKKKSFTPAHISIYNKDVPWILGKNFIKSIKEKNFEKLNSIIKISKEHNINQIIPIPTNFIKIEKIIDSFIYNDKIFTLVESNGYSLITTIIKEDEIILHALNFLSRSSRDIEDIQLAALSELHYNKKCDKEFFLWKQYSWIYDHISNDCEQKLIKYIKEGITSDNKNGRIMNDIKKHLSRAQNYNKIQYEMY